MSRSQLSLSLFAVILLAFASCKKDDFVENKVPVADAGSSQTTTLPADSVRVNGTGTDADGKVVAYLWSQVSGPAATTIVNPGSPSTAIRGFAVGNYVFQLMVTDDKGATGVDTLSVSVKPSVVQTLTLQPANNPTEVLLLYNATSNPGFVATNDLPIQAWTDGGPFNLRAILKFDLSSIPSTANITSANLYLYSYPSPTPNGNQTDANFGSDNAMMVQQVSANWSPSTINWSNQPAATATNQVIAPQTNQSVLDLNLNVTAMVKSMVSGSANYGFLLKLQNEVIYNSRNFVSSHSATHTTKYPKLVVVYQ